MHNKRITILSAIIILVIGILVFVLYKPNKNVDMDSLKDQLLLEYDEINEYDESEISRYFGIDNEYLTSSLFITDYIEDEDNYLFEPNELVMVIKTSNPKEVYTFLKGFVDSNINNRDNTSNLSLYTNSILKKKRNYVYLVMGSKNEKIEKIIKKYL